MKTVLQIIGIAVFFSLVGYILTYPYELAYKGTEDIILIEESYEFTSLKEVMGRPEFKGKALYIRVWSSLDHEFYNYTLKEKEKQRDSIIKVIENDTVNPNVMTSERTRNQLLLSGRMGIPRDMISSEHQLKYLREMQEKYKNENAEFVFLMHPHSEIERKEDYLRKWKATIKKHQIKGSHFVISQELLHKLLAEIKAVKGNMFLLPHNYIVDKQGNIVNNNAASPSFEKEKLFKEFDSILKQ